MIALDLETGQTVLTQLGQLLHECENRNVSPVLACAPQVRAGVRRMVQPALGRLPVLSYNEITGSAQVRSAGVVTGQQVAGAMAAGQAGLA